MELFMLGIFLAAALALWNRHTPENVDHFHSILPSWNPKLPTAEKYRLYLKRTIPYEHARWVYPQHMVIKEVHPRPQWGDPTDAKHGVIYGYDELFHPPGPMILEEFQTRSQGFQACPGTPPGTPHRPELLQRAAKETA